MSNEERKIRNNEIYRLHRKGLSNIELAKAFSLGEKVIARIIKQKDDDLTASTPKTLTDIQREAWKNHETYGQYMAREYGKLVTIEFPDYVKKTERR